MSIISIRKTSIFVASIFTTTKAITALVAAWFILTAAIANSADESFDKSKGSVKPVVLVLGDSLSAAYGMDERVGWVQLLRQAIDDEYPHKIVNASVSGETAGGGLARLPSLLAAYQPKVVIVELGGNDGLRGYPLNIMQQKLDQIINKAQEANAQVLLLGMKIPPNYGERYTTQFEQVFVTLANKYKLGFVPFFLAGVATDSKLMQRDGIHPNEQAQKKMMRKVLPVLKPLLVSL